MDRPDGLFAQMQAVTHSREGEGERAYAEASARRLQAILRRKLTTAFIGALAQFEKHFGGLWGHGRPTTSLTADEREWRARWEACRTDALNVGNTQVRAVRNELDQYQISWNRHRLVLPALPPHDQE